MNGETVWMTKKRNRIWGNLSKIYARFLFLFIVKIENDPVHTAVCMFGYAVYDRRETDADCRRVRTTGSEAHRGLKNRLRPGNFWFGDNVYVTQLPPWNDLMSNVHPCWHFSGRKTNVTSKLVITARAPKLLRHKHSLHVVLLFVRFEH